MTACSTTGGMFRPTRRSGSFRQSCNTWCHRRQAPHATLPPHRNARPRRQHQSDSRTRWRVSTSASRPVFLCFRVSKEPASLAPSCCPLTLTLPARRPCRPLGNWGHVPRASAIFDQRRVSIWARTGMGCVPPSGRTLRAVKCRRSAPAPNKSCVRRSAASKTFPTGPVSDGSSRPTQSSCRSCRRWRRRSWRTLEDSA